MGRLGWIHEDAATDVEDALVYALMERGRGGDSQYLRPYARSIMHTDGHRAAALTAIAQVLAAGWDFRSDDVLADMLLADDMIADAIRQAGRS